jgi:hypothetical protein
MAVWIQPKRISRRSAWVVIGLLAAAYTLIDAKVIDDSPSLSVHTMLQEQSAIGMTSGLDVPASVETDIMDRLTKAVNGLDEVVILPMNHSSGYQVTATVNLGYPSDFDPVLAKPLITKSADQFFQSIYSSHEPIVDAQIYYQSNGVTVAGAGLGRDAYRKLSEGVFHGGGEIVSAISTATDSASGSTEDEWFEISEKVAP